MFHTKYNFKPSIFHLMCIFSPNQPVFDIFGKQTIISKEKKITMTVPKKQQNALG